MVGGEAFCGPTRSQSFSEAMPLDCTSGAFLSFSYPPLGGTGWPECIGVGYYPPPDQLVSDKTLVG